MFRFKNATFSALLYGAFLSQAKMTLGLLTGDEIAQLETIARQLESTCVLVGCQDPVTETSRRDLFETPEAHLARKLVPTEVVDCILESLVCNLYLDSLYLPPISDYDFVEVCLSESKDKFPGFDECKKKDVIDFTNKEDPKSNEFRYQDSGPESLQGVFWLNYSPNRWSSLVTFAETRESAGGIATGTLGDVTGDFPLPTGPLSSFGEYDYLIRVLGDHNWAFGKSSRVHYMFIDLVFI
jgi:hypothetical protein